MATLNTLAYQVAGAFDRDTDVIFIERIKELLAVLTLGNCC